MWVVITPPHPMVRGGVQISLHTSSEDILSIISKNSTYGSGKFDGVMTVFLATTLSFPVYYACMARG